MISQSGLNEVRPITEDEEGDFDLGGYILGIDGLNDLAWCLTRDDREAMRLVGLTLRAFGPRTLESMESMHVLLNRLVRNYLRHNRSFASRVSRVTSKLRVRRTGCQEAPSQLEIGLDRLPPEERVSLILRERLGLPLGEIAQVTGLGRERVSYALFSARERLVAFLHDEDTRLRR